MIFLLDENVCRRLVYVIKANDERHEARLMVDEYRPGMDDVDWMSFCSKMNPKPYIVGGDKGLIKRRYELEALRGSGLTYVFLDGWQNVPWQTANWQLLKCWPSLVATLQAIQGPHLIRLKTSGKLEISSL